MWVSTQVPGSPLKALWDIWNFCSNNSPSEDWMDILGKNRKFYAQRSSYLVLPVCFRWFQLVDVSFISLGFCSDGDESTAGLRRSRKATNRTGGVLICEDSYLVDGLNMNVIFHFIYGMSSETH